MHRLEYEFGNPEEPKYVVLTPEEEAAARAKTEELQAGMAVMLAENMHGPDLVRRFMRDIVIRSLPETHPQVVKAKQIEAAIIELGIRK